MKSSFSTTNHYTHLSINKRQIKLDSTIKPFDCGDDDLNDFLLSKAAVYRNALLATTFVIENETETLAYFSILNDSLKLNVELFNSKSAFKRFIKQFVSHAKSHIKNFPALKIGRLAINKKYQGNGLGKLIIDMIIADVINLNDQQACKLITIDAYQKSLLFYEKVGFKYINNNDENEDTRQMYLDISQIKNDNQF